jgi:hypothetical protein
MGIYQFKMANGNVQRIDYLQNGKLASTNTSGDTVYYTTCISPYTLIMLYASDKSVTPLTPCSNQSKGYAFFGKGIFRRARLSYDKEFLAVSVEQTYGVYDDFNTITVYDRLQNEVNRFDRYHSPAWLPDGRLLLLSFAVADGLYIVDKDFTGDPVRIENTSIPSGAYDLSISLSGKKILYIYSSRIWIMDINGDNKKYLPTMHSDIAYAVLSPDEKYVAYVRIDSKGRGDKILYFYELKTNQTFYQNSHEIFYPDSNGGFWDKYAMGPISWIKSP